MRYGFRISLALSCVLLFLLGLLVRHLQDLGNQYHAGAYMLDLIWRPPHASPKVEQPSAVGDKVIVMAALEEEKVEWLEQELPDWQRAIYVVNPSQQSLDDPDVLTTPMNKGHESMAYLSYVIDHYNSLAATIAFLHPHRAGFLRAWHVDAPLHDNAIAMQSLELDFVQQNGYVNLRCNWNPGCTGVDTGKNGFITDEVWREVFAETNSTILATAGEETNGSSLRESGGAINMTTRRPAEQQPLKAPEDLGVACCAQFAVSRDQVLKRPLEDYVEIRQWLMDTDRDDATSGRIMEYLWHIIFGKDAVYCPEESICYCQVYGQC